MPEIVIRNGKRYTEYTVKEIEAIRLEGYVKLSRASGRSKSSPLTQVTTIGEGRKNTVQRD